MKTLNTLLALALLVSSAAPVCAMEGEKAPVSPVAAKLAPDVDGAASSDEESSSEEAPKAEDKKDEAETEVKAESFFDKAKAFADEKATAVKRLYAFDKEAKAKSFLIYGVTAAAVAAVVGGLVYLFTGDDSSDEEIDEEIAPVEPQVQTVVEAPVVVKTPVAKAPVRKPRPGKNRCGKTARVKRGGCRKGCK